MSEKQTVEKIQETVRDNLEHVFGVTLANANDEQCYKAAALAVRNLLEEARLSFVERAEKTRTKHIYYLCMEFLVGRSLKNSLYNLGLESAFRKALAGMGLKLDALYEQEPDAGLGNGGLGRLAACYMDALATLGYPATGYSLRYEYGIFRQKLVDGWQTELPDFWLPGGKVWLKGEPEKSVEVRFNGHIDDYWNNGYHVVNHKDYTKVIAVPYDMYLSGYGGKGVSRLRLWAATSAEFDMKLFNGGNYMRAMEQKAMAEVITKVLYPDDNHLEGKSLRLSQQYFLVSASIQDLIRHHLFSHRTLDSLPDLVAIHLNDTHPVLAIPEMMRVMMDECGYGWDAAWEIVQSVFGYTNHTVMAEALECWGIDLFRSRLPRIYQIVEEINRRFCAKMHAKGVDGCKVGRMAPWNDGYVKMANLAVVGSRSVNGVSKLHSDILKNRVFHDFYTEMPEKFLNVTNGIAHRRWLCQANPGLSALIAELIGGGYVRDASKLAELMPYTDDPAVLEKMAQVKRRNKVRLAEYVKKANGIEIDPDSIFDVQVKRLHEYKRQHLNALQILADYRRLRENPGMDFRPRTYIFGAKAAPGYYFAKQIIRFIVDLGKTINGDPRVNKKMRVVYLEDYRVTLAELLMPAADISEQISLAGTEASGTSNMKLMINGAVTLGTLDGANVEIHDAVGDENMILFGMTAPQVSELKNSGYRPKSFADGSPAISGALREMDAGFCGVSFHDIADSLLNRDPYMVLADFASYEKARAKSAEWYADPAAWQRMCLVNVAQAGRFAADRAVREYAEKIWRAQPVPPEENEGKKANRRHKFGKA
ncbi:MAG: glycogen/starch/alpha-glucan phosphorylase [Oscillospiraceae bacterium]|jgi:starch phosphorylase|nr:glycogen/starch/alpha-glucan phosphorylase [Oscillospiraceae bacterium]MCI1989740.1 glycogen/starch/alpha-glucan phosphorylase [Oscillospiraceae bacterium]MCI2034343.1 glycogen/starch/alpha-glucan phosphorylase [Oscillospiraceae bacterium]